MNFLWLKMVVVVYVYLYAWCEASNVVAYNVVVYDLGELI